jgi:integrase
MEEIHGASDCQQILIGTQPVNKETQKSDNTLTPSWVDKILNCSEEELRRLFHYSYVTGLRVSELINLQWDDVEVL